MLPEQIFNWFLFGQTICVLELCTIKALIEFPLTEVDFFGLNHEKLEHVYGVRDRGARVDLLDEIASYELKTIR